MRKHKTIFFCIFSLILALALTGCMQLDTDVGIDREYNAYITHHVQLDLSDLDFRQRKPVRDSVDQLLNHYADELGFAVDAPDDQLGPRLYDFTMTKAMPGGSYEEAFANLQQMLTDEALTPFMAVDMATATAEQQQLYSLETTLDFSKVLALSNLADFPPSVQEDIESRFSTCSGTVTFQLPGSQIESATGTAEVDGHQVFMQAPVNFGAPSSQKLVTRLNLGGGLPQDRPMEDILQGLRGWRIFGIGLGAAGLVTVVVGLVVLLRAKKKRAALVTPGADTPTGGNSL